MIEVRRIRPGEYVDAGEVTASAWGTSGSFKDEEGLSFRARVADVAGRDAVAAVYIVTKGRRIFGSVTLELEQRIDDEEKENGSLIRVISSPTSVLFEPGSIAVSGDHVWVLSATNVPRASLFEFSKTTGAFIRTLR